MDENSPRRFEWFYLLPKNFMEKYRGGAHGESLCSVNPESKAWKSEPALDC